MTPAGERKVLLEVQKLLGRPPHQPHRWALGIVGVLGGIAAMITASALVANDVWPAVEAVLVAYLGGGVAGFSGFYLLALWQWPVFYRHLDRESIAARLRELESYYFNGPALPESPGSPGTEGPARPDGVTASRPPAGGVPAELVRLANLRDDGTLTEEKYRTAKAAVLADLEPRPAAVRVTLLILGIALIGWGGMVTIASGIMMASGDLETPWPVVAAAAVFLGVGPACLGVFCVRWSVK